MNLASLVVAGIAAGLVLPAVAQVPRTPSVDGATVRIIAPEDGATVTSPFTVVFGLAGMGIAPAGVQQENTGHHHLLLNGELPPFDSAIPADESSIHYGGGQTEATLELAPGEYTLQLLLGDWQHVPHEPPVYSEPITVSVE